jgi:8-oxo-dGTP pyrophosphatase MutT (NUDIX family)
MNFPVSIKGVFVEAGGIVLLENDRDEWELPGGRLEPGEAPEDIQQPSASTAGCPTLDY